VDGSQSEARDTPLLQSLITLGKQEWTLVPTQGSPVCIAPQGTDKFPVCFISKLVDGTKIALGQFTKIRKGCATGTDRIAVHFCINYDSGKILRIDDLGASELKNGIIFLKLLLYIIFYYILYRNARKSLQDHW
jgi:hypothetical protein